MSRILHGYYRSTAAYRVRIALNLKGLDYQQVGVHLVRGEQRDAAYLGINPQGLVPALRDGSSSMTQSLAIIEYLDERYPDLPLLPKDLEDRTRVRQLSLAIACEIHPLNNLRVLQYLGTHLGAGEPEKQRWIAHWITLGFAALESELQRGSERGFCVGGSPTMADCCLIPQVFNARRFEVDMSPFPRISNIVKVCELLPAFSRAHPSKQPDTP